MTSMLDYSTTAGNNTTVGGVSIAEGMAPGSVNNAIRAALADSRKAQLDAFGITTAGTGNTYTITTNQVIASYVNLMRFTFKADRTNTGAATLNVDGRGAKTIKKLVNGSAVDLVANDITSGGVYDVSYASATDTLIAFNIGPVPESATISVSGGETALDFTGIPTWATEITLLLDRISLSGTDDLDIRLGDSGGFISTGYIAPYGHGIAGTTITAATGDTGIPVRMGAAAQKLSCIVTIRRRVTGATLWFVSYVGTRGAGGDAGAATVIGGGSLIVTLTQIRIRPSGTDTFDNGSANIVWK